jgi:hypothetical protein
MHCLPSNYLVTHGFSLGLFKDDFSTALALYNKTVGLFSLMIFKSHRDGLVFKRLSVFLSGLNEPVGRFRKAGMLNSKSEDLEYEGMSSTRFTSC